MSHDHRITAVIHLAGDLDPVVKFYPDGIPGQPVPYAAVDFADLTIFVNSPQHATALAATFADVAGRFAPAAAVVTDQARQALAEFAEWQAEPATGTDEDGHPRQYRYAEFCGRFSTLLSELVSDEPDATDAS